jgi:hypothetical protein
VTKVFKKALETIVTLKAITVFKEVTAVINISYYLHNRKSVIFVINQVASQQNTLLKSKSKRIISLANTLSVFIKNPQPYTIKAF